MLIFRTTIVLLQPSGIVTLFRWLFRPQVTRGTCGLNSNLKRVTIPDAVIIQLSSWRWA